MELGDDALLRYSRHLLLPTIDIAGQRRLLQARALIIGVGGLGSPLALYLAGAGVGHLTIADGDQVELSNLARQILYCMTDLGINKAQAACTRIAQLNPTIHTVPIAQRIEPTQWHALIARHDIVIDCSDHFATRHAVNRAAHACAVPLVLGAALQFCGQMTVFDFRNPDSPCYHCLFPEQGRHDEEPCTTLGVFSPLAGVIGSLQAAEAIKLLIGLAPRLGVLTLYDAHAGEFSHVYFERDLRCRVCGA